MNVWIRFLSGPVAGDSRAFWLAPGMAARIGSAEDNEILLPPPVESHHAQIRNEGGALLVYSMSRIRGGDLLRGGQKIVRAPVRPGDRIQLGQTGPEFEIYFEVPVAAPPPPPPPVPRPAPAPPPMAAPPPYARTIEQPAYGAAPPPPPIPRTAPQPTFPGAGAPSLPPQTPRCGICAGNMAQGSFVCYKCRRTLCVYHYDEAAGVCESCSGASAGAPTAPARAAHGRSGTAPAMPAMPAAPARTGTAPAIPVPGVPPGHMAEFPPPRADDFPDDGPGRTRPIRF